MSAYSLSAECETPGVTPGGDEVMPSVNGITPDEPSSAFGTPSGPSSGGAVVAGAVGGKNYLYIGIKDFVICRDITNIAAAVEVWRKKFDEPTGVHVAFSGGVVVAVQGDLAFGLDPLTGEERWRHGLKSTPFRNIISILATPFVVYLAYKNYVDVISSQNGQVLWQYQFKSTFDLPTVLVCGVRTVLVGGSDVVCLNTLISGELLIAVCCQT